MDRDIANFFANLANTYSGGLQQKREMKIADLMRQRNYEDSIRQAVAMEQALQAAGVGRYTPEPVEPPFSFTGEVLPAYTNKTGFEIQNGLPMPIDMQVPTDFGYIQTGKNSWDKVDLSPEEDPILQAVAKEQALINAGVKVNPVLAQAQDNIAKRIDSLVTSNQPIPKGMLDEYKKLFGYDYDYKPYQSVAPNIPNMDIMPFDEGYPGLPVPSRIPIPSGGPSINPPAEVRGIPDNPIARAKNSVIDIAAGVANSKNLGELGPEAPYTNKQRIAYEKQRTIFNEANNNLRAEIDYYSTLTDSPKDAEKRRASQARINSLSQEAAQAKLDAQNALQPDKEQKEKQSKTVASAKKEILGQMYKFQGGDKTRYAHYYSFNDANDYIDTLDIPVADKNSLKSFARSEWNKNKSIVDSAVKEAKRKKADAAGKGKDSYEKALERFMNNRKQGKQ